MSASLLIQSEYFLRIVIACICGSIIGYERENRNKVAGIRTHAIVALGSALIIIVSKYGFYDIPDYDASRVAAQIVSGIGFLGAGIIFVRNGSISGLTTAAGIWATSGIGMAIGAGLYYIGAVTTIFMIIIQIIMHKKYFLKEHRYENIEFVLDGNESDLSGIRVTFQEHSIEIMSLKYKRLEDGLRINAEVILPLSIGKLALLELLAEGGNIRSTKF